MKIELFNVWLIDIAGQLSRDVHFKSYVQGKTMRVSDF